MEILISKENEVDASCTKLLRELASYALNLEKVPDKTELSIALVKKEKIQELNLKHRGKNSATDVLSYPLADEGEESTPLAESLLLGEVIISPEVAEFQAKDYGHSLEEELSILLVHGILHLLDYDHQAPEEAERMRNQERVILKGFFVSTKGEK